METWRTGQKLLYGFLKDANLSTNEGGGLEIACAPLQIAILERNRKEIVGTLESLIGHRVDVGFVPGRNTTEANRSQSAKDGEEQTSTPLALQREAQQDPQLSPVLELFDAKILKIDLK